MDTAIADRSTRAVLPAVRKVVQVFKSHLDVGFTASAAKITHDAIRWWLPTAAGVAARLRARGGRERLVWTVPAWLARTALETLDGEALSTVERALGEGDLAWHALPFTMHTELLDEGLCAWSTSISRGLDRRFGRRTVAAKLTDVPGHSRGLVTALARSGIEFLHIGVNHMSAMPQVPPCFRWLDQSGNGVTVAYEHGYGGRVQAPGDGHLLRWRIIGDNMEIPSEEDVVAWFADAAAEYPGAEIVAGRLDDYAAGLAGRCATLPVIAGEIGDSWIHGSGSDPWKTQRFRALQRLRARWTAAGRLDPQGAEHANFATALLLAAEHTWGVSFGAHTHHDREHWSNADFARVRTRGCFLGAEASWQEQRDYLDQAQDALSAPLRAEAQAELAALAPRPVGGADWQPVDGTTPITLGGWCLRLGADGAITSLIGNDRKERVTAGGALARVGYQTFGDAECRRFVAQYCSFQAEWLLEEFAKQGLAVTHPQGAWHGTRLLAARVRRGGASDELALDLALPASAVIEAGAPARLQVVVGAPAGQQALTFRLSWWDKHPTRLPEALWWSFQPAVTDPDAWRLDKLGQDIDPRAVMSRGGRSLHGVGRGAWCQADGTRVDLLTPDAHLIAPGRPQLYEFTDELPDLRGGLHLNLVNNLWGTNFPMWCGDDLAVRAELRWS